jgi:uroporphyrin-III C-methyltransferase / precorrin-2 dehydrogenase / sirohydrochlorin ferrochelatase
MPLSVADVGDQSEAKAFTCAMRAAGVPFKVIDKPAFCQFQFGAIVNRSLLVVSISTYGAAPILGQAVRHRIEMLLLTTLAYWTCFAKEIRKIVMETVPAGQTLLRQAVQNDNRAKGKVTLVGAGPGDAELLTVKAVRALQAADVILHDDLVSDDVLEWARREAKRMLVGKRGGRKSCRQENINAMMLTLAKAGKNVVRLKSGDPIIFGRAGEEIAMLEGEGVADGVVPGITEALAMVSALGVSLTYSDYVRSVRFVTGHNSQGKLQDDIDWRAASDPKTTTIF